jgi:DNA-binding transcriptional LysR family regulator
MADIRGVDLNLLVVLDALLDERSVTRAAARLGYTQSTTSGMLARLRDVFADPLFVRVQRGIMPTPRAQGLAIPLKQLLADGRRIVARETFDPATAENTFAVSANDYMQRTILVPFIKELRRVAPKIKLTIKPAIVAGLADALVRGDLDLALTIPQFSVPELPSRLLYHEHYVAIVGRGHPLATARRISLETFCRCDHILVSPTGGSFVGPTDEALAGIGRRRNVRYSVPSFLFLPELLQDGDLVALVPSRLVRIFDKRFRLFKPPVNVPSFDVIAVWHPRMDKDSAHQWLLARITETAQAMRSDRAI